MTDERLREGLKKFSRLSNWAIEEILERNYQHRFSLSIAYVKKKSQFYDELKLAAEGEKNEKMKEKKPFCRSA